LLAAPEPASFQPVPIPTPLQNEWPPILGGQPEAQKKATTEANERLL
jgi:hypothetical protein